MQKAFSKALNAFQIDWKEKDILLAISGGLDSVALFHLLLAEGIPFRAAHVNYALRDNDSDKDENFVRELCIANKIELDVMQVAKEHWKGQNIQNEARKIRYTFFDSLGADFIFLAHHQDDLVESVLMNIVRGSGIRGLVGMKDRQKNLIRPLLSFPKDDLRSYLEENENEWREDASNFSDKYKRNRFRHDIIPLLKKENPSLNQAIERLRENTHSLVEDMELSFKEFRSSLVSEEEGQVRIAKGRPDLLDKHLFDLLLEYDFNSDQSRSIILSLAEVGKTFHSSSHSLLIDRKDLIIYKEHHSESPELEIYENTSALLEPLRMKFRSSEVEKIHSDAKVFQFDKEKLVFPLVLRKWRNGDRMQPLGMSGTKKLSDILIDKKINRIEKDETYVLLSNEEIIWLSCGVVSERFKLSSQSKEQFELTII